MKRYPKRFRRVEYWKRLRSLFLLTIPVIAFPTWQLYDFLFGISQGIFPNIYDDSTYYFSKILAASKDDFFQTRVYFTPFTPQRIFNFEFLGASLVGLISKLTFSNIFVANYIYQFIMFITLVWAIKSIHSTIDQGISNFGTVFSMFLLLVLKPDFLYRPILPISAIVITILYVCVKTRADRRASGFLKYMSVYLAGLAIYINLFFAIPMILREVFFTRFEIKRIFLMTLLTFPFVSNNIIGLLTSSGDDSFRWGVIHSHAPGAIKETAYGLMFLMFHLLIGRRIFVVSKNRVAEEIIALMLLSWIMMNSQIITGISVEFGSHFGQVIIFLSMIYISLCISHFLSKWNRKEKVSITLISVGLLFVSVNQVYNLVRSDSASKEVDRHTLSSFDISVVRERDIVAGSEEVIDLLPLYTGAEILYSARAVTLSTMSNTEAIDRFLLDKFLEQTECSTQAINPSVYMARKYTEELFERRIIGVKQRAQTEKRLFGESELLLESNLRMKVLQQQLLSIWTQNYQSNFEELKAKYRVSRVLYKNC